MLLAGTWGGVRFQGTSFFLALTLGTLGVFVGTILYGLASKRLRVLLLLPLLILAIVGQELVATLFLLGGLIGSPIAVLVATIQSTRKNWILAGQMGLIAFAAITSIFLYGRLQVLGVRRAADRGEGTIEAIHRYQKRERALPNSLDELVPRDLASIPETGMAGFPSFEYIAPSTEANNDEERLFATYELSVNLYKLLQYDCLVYWPEGHYPRMMYGGGVERIGVWAYVHE